MRGARRFFLREKQVFLVGFSLAIPRFPHKSKKRLNTNLAMSYLKNSILYSPQNLLLRFYWTFLTFLVVTHSCNYFLELTLQPYCNKYSYIHVIFHEREEYFWCSLLHTLRSILTEIRFKMNICFLLYKVIS